MKPTMIILAASAVLFLAVGHAVAADNRVQVVPAGVTPNGSAVILNVDPQDVTVEIWTDCDHDGNPSDPAGQDCLVWGSAGNPTDVHPEYILTP